MSGAAAQAARGSADDGFSCRVEREAVRLRRLALELNGTGVRSFWTRGVRVDLVCAESSPSQAAQAEDGEYKGGAKQVSVKRQKAR